MARRGVRSARAYRRKEAVREPYDTVLVVCEGGKTEPEYFQGLRKVLRLSSANITVVPSHYGNDPVSVVRYAIDTHKQEKESYDRMYCVFDRDGHANYEQALDRVNHIRLRKGKLEAITSVPCFEIWVLLHYEYTAAPYAAAGGKSACDRVIESIRIHLPQYEKALAGVFEKLHARIDRAIAHAERLSNENRETRSDNPATRVHELVNYLRSLMK